jgi:hypothetical protein
MNFRPRYSLRTLLVAVTIVAIALGWLAWQRRIVTQRGQLIDEINKTYPSGMMFSWKDTPEEDKTTWLRKQLGDISYGLILLPEDASDDLVRRTRNLFPNSYQKQGQRLHKLN